MIDISCLLIGNASLLSRCGDALAAAGVVITHVVTEDGVVRDWARTRGLPVAAFDRDLPASIGHGSVDYLFSVGNTRVLGADWLAVPRRCAINFHDGPLPRYAGLHATSWALLQRESRHGITWHVATPVVDAGAILEQELFDVSPGETALTLNAKCYEAGLVAFERLIARLADGTLEPRSAPEAPHSYFGRSRRPAAAGYVDWRRPLEDIDALVRALDFGPYPNPLCTPWTLRDGAVVRVDRAMIGSQRVSPSAESDLLPPELARSIGERHEAWSGAEAGWVAACASLQPLVVSGDAVPSGTWESLPFDVDGRPSVDGATLAAAVALWLARESDEVAFDVGYSGPVLDAHLPGLERWFEPLPPLRITSDRGRSWADGLADLQARMAAHDARGTFLRDIVHRYPALHGRSESDVSRRLQVAITVGPQTRGAGGAEAALLISVPTSGGPAEWRFDPARLSRDRVAAMQTRCRVTIQAGLAEPTTPLARLPLVGTADRHTLLVDWNATAQPIAGPRTVTAQFAAQVARTPDAVALVAIDGSCTYRELDRRARRVAVHLSGLGVGRDALVGIHLGRSSEVMVAVLGVLQAGAAYVPLDPTHPADRTAYIANDSGAAFVLTERALADRFGPGGPRAIVLDGPEFDLASAPDGGTVPDVDPRDLAYVIYTSGSTGTPKGVMIAHENLTAFFAAMDARIDHAPPGVWLAVTSLSFDISGLELLWTLCRGFRVVLQPETGFRELAGAVSSRPVGFSLFYFSSDETGEGAARYRLLMEGAAYADRHDFEAVWTPERHFHAFGGLYPNPAITSAAVAAVTSRVKIRAGSLVMPLHHPIRVAEDWALVDNLSGGRVGVAFASGWHPNDFVFNPGNFAAAKDVMFDGLATVRRLWKGEAVTFTGPRESEVSVRTLPRPVQPELPVWITTAGNVETYRQAGRVGANLLTHLLGQTLEEVADKIRAYRDERRAAGHAGDGHVTLMLHTFVGDTDDGVRELVRAPMKQYLRSSLNLVRQHAWSFPAFRGRPAAPDVSTEELFRSLSSDDMEALLDHAFERYFRSGGLFGSIETCRAQVERVRGIGVDEIACLIDFGVESDRVLAGLDRLNAVRQATAAPDVETPPSMARMITRHGVTHFQCTPSMAAMLVDDPAATAALGHLEHWLIGGEVLPAPLARRVRATGAARVSNMYGPTETTIWSLSHDLDEDDTPVPIGRPIANTRVYVLDAAGELVPIGREGELYIGGPMVARGYHRRPELTAARFVDDPFGQAGGRLYRTGDRVRFRDDGVLEFLGRVDHQVKLRGHRIELGEIEARLRVHPGVRDAVVVAREGAPGELRLVGYVAATRDTSGADIRRALRGWLPDVMVPSAVVVLDALPLSPNGKIDRRALPAPETVAAPVPVAARPADDLQRRIAAMWSAHLHAPDVGVDDNFFDLGGHSLLAVQVVGAMNDELSRRLTITDLFRFPTVRRLAAHLAGDAARPAAALPVADGRAAARKAALQRRARQSS